MLNTSVRPSAVIIDAPEKLVVDTRRAWRELVLDLIPRIQGRPLVIDMAKCRYVDSSGLGTLESIRLVAKAKEIRVILAAPQPDVLTLFGLVKMTASFEIADSLDGAIEKAAH
jgi:anti-anti-sigma factor